MMERGSLLQAKAVGMLSISIFVVLITYHKKRINIKIEYVSDNLELINTSKEHLIYNNLYLKNALSVKFDIKEQIYLTNKTYKINKSFQHVHDHQDTKSRGEMLVETKLNVGEDKLAHTRQF